MKKLLLLSILSISVFANAQLAANKRLIVPEFGTNAGNNKVKTYFPTSATTMAADPNYTINFSTLGNGLATNASPNVVTMRNNDLYVTLALANQRIYKFPGYGNNPASAIANVSQITADGNDYVGIAFDAVGNLYCSEGNFLDTKIVKYTIASNYSSASKINLGNGGITSYFANITFDVNGNLWATDYQNNRLIAIRFENLSTPNATFQQLVNAAGSINPNGAVNSNSQTPLTPLSITLINVLFSNPEGLAFDNDGNLWIANNNEALNFRGTIVKLVPGYLNQILGPNVGIFPNTHNFQAFLINSAAFIYNMPTPPNSFSSKFGGLQIDSAISRVYVNEQQGGAGLAFSSIATALIQDDYNLYKMNMVSTNPGNGGIFLADAASNFLANDSFEINSIKISFAPNPSNGSFNILTSQKIETATAFDLLGKEINLTNNGNNSFFIVANSGIYFIKVAFANGSQTTQKLIIQ